MLLCFNRYALVVNGAGQAVSGEPSVQWNVQAPHAFAQIGDTQLCIVGRSAVEVRDLAANASSVVSLPRCSVLGAGPSHVYLAQNDDAATHIVKLERAGPPSLSTSLASTFSSLIQASESAMALTTGEKALSTPDAVAERRDQTPNPSSSTGSTGSSVRSSGVSADGSVCGLSRGHASAEASRVFTPKNSTLTNSAFAEHFTREMAKFDDVLGAFDL